MEVVSLSLVVVIFKDLLKDRQIASLAVALDRCLATKSCFELVPAMLFTLIQVLLHLIVTNYCLACFRSSLRRTSQTQCSAVASESPGNDAFLERMSARQSSPVQSAFTEYRGWHY